MSNGEPGLAAHTMTYDESYMSAGQAEGVAAAGAAGWAEAAAEPDAEAEA